MKLIDFTAKTNWKFIAIVAVFSLVVAILAVVTVMVATKEQVGLQPVRHLSEYTEVTVKELKENPIAYDNQKVMVRGIYRWGFEESNFDETINQSSADAYYIWIEIDKEKTKLENIPENFNYEAQGEKLVYGKGKGRAEATIYGTFHAFDPNAPTKEFPGRGNFGHLGLWKYEIMAERIIFGNSIDASVFEQKILALTNKLTYSLGEEVSAVVGNNEDKDIWISMLCSTPFILQKYTGAEWKSYGPYPTKKCYFPAESIKAHGHQQYALHLKGVYEYKGFSIESGQYRFYFRYSFANLNLVGQKAQFFDAFSNEFTIGAPKTSQLNARIVGAYASPGESSKVAVFGDTAYLTDISDGLLAIDVSDPTKPKLLGSIKIDGGGAYAIALPDPYFVSREYTPQPIFVSGYGNSKFVAIDVSNPKNLKIVARGEAKRSIQNMVSFGSDLYLAIDGPEFEVFDAIPDFNELGFGRLKSIGTIPATPGGHVLDIKALDFLSGSVFFGSVLLVAQGEKGIALFRLDKGGPIPMETLDVGGYAHAVGVNNYNPINKVAADVISSSELIVVGINPFGDARNLQEKARFQLQGSGEAIAVYGGIGAVALWEKGVEILDLQEPLDPISLGVVDTPGRARDVAIQEKGNKYYIYVADDRDDLQIIEFRR